MPLFAREIITLTLLSAFNVLIFYKAVPACVSREYDIHRLSTSCDENF